MNGRALFAEGLGTAFLLAGVVGSGIMAEQLAGGSVALALLCNALATGALLVVLILLFAPLSGAQLNPAVTLALAIEGTVPWRAAGWIVSAQLAGGIAGTFAAHAMFSLPLFQSGTTERAGSGQWLAEGIATFGLVLVILGLRGRRSAAVPVAVGLYIVAAYWFTSSTSFANPAATVARALTDTFTGIAPSGVPGFVLAQLIGTFAAIIAARLMWPRPVAEGTPIPDATARVTP